MQKPRSLIASIHIVGVSVLFAFCWTILCCVASSVSDAAPPEAVPSVSGTAPNVTETSYNPSDPRWAEKRRKDKDDPNWQWKIPIFFFGKIVDENNQPVEGASIRFQWSDLSEEGASESKTSSDASGRFQLGGVKGKGLDVRVSKQGYYNYKDNRLSFEYAGFWEDDFYVPSQTSPVIFRLKRQGQLPALFHKVIRKTVPNDGSENQFRIDNPTQPPTALTLNVSKYSAEKTPNHYQNDWWLKLSIDGGGLVQNRDAFPFEAPSEGYQAVKVDMPASLGDRWRGSIQNMYFFTYGNPRRYGRMMIMSVGSQGQVNIEYWLNPSGSRNLEADPNQAALYP